MKKQLLRITWCITKVPGGEQFFSHFFLFYSLREEHAILCRARKDKPNTDSVVYITGPIGYINCVTGRITNTDLRAFNGGNAKVCGFVCRIGRVIMHTRVHVFATIGKVTPARAASQNPPHCMRIERFNG